MADNNITDAIQGAHSYAERVITSDEYDCLYSPEKQERQQVPIFKQNLYDKNAQKYYRFETYACRPRNYGVI